MDSQTIAQILQANGGKMTGSASGTSGKSSAQITSILQAAGGKPTGGSATTQASQSPIAGLPLGQTIYDMGAGVDKQIASLPFTVASLGKNIANTVGKVPGLGFLKTKQGSPADLSTQTPQALQPKNTAEQVGSVAAQIGELFLPGAQEKAAIGGIDALVNGLDDTKIASMFGEKAPAIVKGLLKMAGAGGVTATSMGGVTAAQTGGDVGKTETAAITGGVAGALGKAFDVFGPSISRSIAKSNLKMSPMVEAKLGPKANQAASFIADNNIPVNPARGFKVLSGITDDFENAIQKSVGNDIQVSTKDLNDALDSIPKQFENEPAIYKSVKGDVAEAKTTLAETKGDSISMSDLLSGKRSYGKAAFGKATAQVKGTLVNSEGAYAIEQAYENVLEDAMGKTNTTISLPENLQGYFGGKTEVTLPEMNQQYSAAINARKLTNVAQFKSNTGLVGRLFGLWAGESLGNVVLPGLGGKIIGGAAGEMLASGAQSGINTGLDVLAHSGGSTVPTAKVGLGMFSPSNPAQPQQ